MYVGIYPIQFIRIFVFLHLNPMKKIFMLNTKVKYPELYIKILTEFDNIGYAEPTDDKIMANMFLYTGGSVYQGKIIKGRINQQLAWNQQSLSIMKESLSGKRQNIEIKFREEECRFALICEIETGINIELFEADFYKIQDCQPVRHMKIMFMQYKIKYDDQESAAKQEKDKISKELTQIKALQKQIEQQTVTQILHMKKNFIFVINECKKHLRKYMKTCINEVINQQQENEMEEPIKKRTIVRVNRQALQKQQRQKSQAMEIEENGKNRNSIGLDQLFD